MVRPTTTRIQRRDFGKQNFPHHQKAISTGLQDLDEAKSWVKVLGWLEERHETYVDYDKLEHQRQEEYWKWRHERQEHEEHEHQ